MTKEYTFTKAAIACEDGDVEEGLKLLQKGLSQTQNQTIYRLVHGIAMFKLGLFTKASEDFEKVVQGTGPENSEYHIAIYNQCITNF